MVANALSASGFAGDLELALLLTSEIVTNAVRHARTPLAVAVVSNSGTVRVEVTDRDPAHLPVVRGTVTPLDPGGRGLRIVDQMAVDWGVTVAGTSKTVWFTSA